MGASGWLPEPDAALVHHQYFGEKHLPLWNPYQSYGAPLAANMQSQPFNPLFFLFALDPGPRTYNFFILARFLLAGLCTYLYLRLFLPFVPSIAGGIACMLSGYYILFFNMPHLSVDMLVPALFLATERLLREQSTGNVMLSAAVTFLCIVGGMPESAFLALAFGGAYFLFRLAAGPHPRTACGHSTQILSLRSSTRAGAGGLSPGSVFRIHGAFVRLASTREPAWIHPRSAARRLWPLAVYLRRPHALWTCLEHPSVPAWADTASLRGFMGVVQVLFAVVAVGGLARRPKTASRPAAPHALLLRYPPLAIVLKRYGAPVINWIGHLPFLPA